MQDIIASVTIDAPIADVWKCLTQQDLIAEWLMPNTFVAKPDHVFTMDCPAGVGNGAPIKCQITDLRPPNRGAARLCYSWATETPPMETKLEIDLIEINGSTRLDLVHSGWSEGEMDLRERHEMGWRHFLNDRLRPLAEST